MQDSAQQLPRQDGRRPVLTGADPAIAHRWVRSNGLTFHVAEAGPEAGPLVILLHGFPEFWYGWVKQIPALVAAGYRVWAPDQRGYNLSDKPAGVGAYAVDQLSRDVVGLISAAGREKAVVIGHDWGAMVAWRVAQRYPASVTKLVAMNVPHPDVMAANLRHNLRQALRSWYVLVFQIPWLPERLLRLGNWQVAANALRRSSKPNTFSDRDLDRYRQAWSQPGAMTAMINWYRAGTRDPAPANDRIRVPTLLLWGAEDRFLGSEMAQPSIDRCDVGNLILYPEATHWLHHEMPAQINHAIVSFVGDQVES